MMFELVVDTVKFYEANPRGVSYADNGIPRCEIETADGHKCAFGRLLDRDVYNTYDWDRLVSVGSECVASSLILHSNIVFKNPEHHKINPTFFDLLQQIHDADMYWRPRPGITRLTPAGKAFLENDMLPFILDDPEPNE
jgi:hypothetical protein